MTNPRMGRRKFLVQAGGWAALPASAAAQPNPDRPPPLPTPAMKDLPQAVRASRPRIGRPVFVRYTRLGGVEAGAVVPLLAGMVADVRTWIEQPSERLFATGAAAGQVCLTVQFRGGATALVSYVRGADRGDGLDLLLLGNHGSITYDSATGSSWDAPLPAPATTDRGLEAVIARALASGRPEKVTQD